MTRALALFAKSPAQAQEALRRMIVCGCALALILAGQALPL
jgi:hypothetical protein